jgi:hypothetical protein
MSYRFAYAFRAQTQKKLPLQNKTFVKHFSQIQKESFKICKVHHANRASKVCSTRANHCFSNWFQTEPVAIMKAESITGPE